MNKDQFWEIIDTINQSEPFESDENYKECVLNTLFPCSFEDLLDWHHIMTLYDRALDRRQLYEKFKESEPQFPRGGFDTFQFWLLSRGKETYFDVLRDPERIKSISEYTVLGQRQGRYLHFVSDDLYFHKHHLYKNGKPGHLPSDLSKHPLDEQTVKEIQDELLREAPLPAPPIVEKPQSPSSIADLVRTGNLLYAAVEDSNEVSRYVFFNTPGNIAHFLGNHRFTDHIVIVDQQDHGFLEADGCYIWDCDDKQLWAEIEKTLAPIQWDEVQPEQFFCPTYEEVEAYLAQRANKHKKQDQKQRQKEPSR